MVFVALYAAELRQLLVSDSKPLTMREKRKLEMRFILPLLILALALIACNPPAEEQKLVIDGEEFDLEEINEQIDEELLKLQAKQAAIEAENYLAEQGIEKARQELERLERERKHERIANSIEEVVTEYPDADYQQIADKVAARLYAVTPADVIKVIREAPDDIDH